MTAEAGGDLLPSWRDGVAKRAILEFVARVITGGGPDFVPIADRVADVDNDGPLWCEQPAYIQFECLLRRKAAMGEWDPALRGHHARRATRVRDYDYFGDIVTRRHQGDDRGASSLTSLARSRRLRRRRAPAGSRSPSRTTGARCLRKADRTRVAGPRGNGPP
jgi:hypothetical protein